MRNSCYDKYNQLDDISWLKKDIKIIHSLANRYQSKECQVSYESKTHDNVVSMIHINTEMTWVKCFTPLKCNIDQLLSKGIPIQK